MPRNARRNAQRDAKPAARAGAGLGPGPTASLAGDAQVITHLNTVLRNELTAINQYFLHSRMLADWGVSQLSQHEYEESVDEMKHADRLIRRILFLGGLPNLQDLGKLLIGESVSEVIACDLKLEQRGLDDLHPAIAHCEAVGDYVSRELFVDILKGEEEHIDFLQTQFRLIEQMGMQNFVQLQTKANSSGASD